MRVQTQDESEQPDLWADEVDEASDEDDPFVVLSKREEATGVPLFFQAIERH